MGPDALAKLNSLRDLREKINAKELLSSGIVTTGLAELDRCLPDGGLRRGAVHEWIGVACWSPQPCCSWSPPLTLLAQVAQRVSSDREGLVVWVGAHVWPYPRSLGTPVLRRSLFVRAPDLDSRLWVSELALRCGAAAAVIADGSGFDRAATQRLQLAAEAGGEGSVCLLARSPDERAVLSAAATRWWVRSEPSDRTGPRWTVELLRCKGTRPAPDAMRPWMVEHDWSEGHLAVLSDVGSGSGQEEDASILQVRTA